MTDTSLLNNLILGSARIPLSNHYSKKKVVLTEHETTGSSIEIHNIPDDAIVIDVDSSFVNEKIFSGSNGECKRADYLILSEEKRIALFIEMKKGNPATGDIINQLKGSLCAYEYFRIIAKKFYNGNASFLDDYKTRFVAFKQVNLSKKKTTIDRVKGKHDSPETLMKISWASTIQFKDIAT